MEDENLMVFMELIMHSGNGKSEAYEAIQFAKAGEFALAEAKIKDAHASLLEAHHVQTTMLTEEAKGNRVLITLLTVHSQDHLMTAMTFLDLAKEFIDVYKAMH